MTGSGRRGREGKGGRRAGVGGLVAGSSGNDCTGTGTVGSKLAKGGYVVKVGISAYARAALTALGRSRGGRPGCVDARTLSCPVINTLPLAIGDIPSR